MVTHPLDNDDALSDLERRLTRWRPDSAGLEADAMLFAAGLAAGRQRRGRLLGPSLCGLLAALAAGLGAWALSERAERQELATRLRVRAPTLSAASGPAVALTPAPSYEPSSGDYLSTRRLMEQDLSGMLASLQPVAPQAPGPPPPSPLILTPHQQDSLSVQ
jgi:hypothetical protein